MAGPSERTRRAGERRRSHRRTLPYVRSAVLEAEGKGHIVTVGDLSPAGAFLATRLPVEPRGPLRLRVVLPGDGREVALPCELVWRNARFDAASGRPAGLAVRFTDLPPEVARRVEECSREGFSAASEPGPGERWEYRVIERPVLDRDELNQLGRDGWRLATALPHPAGVQMVLLRRL